MISSYLKSKLSPPEKSATEAQSWLWFGGRVANIPTVLLCFPYAPPYAAAMVSFAPPMRPRCVSHDPECFGNVHQCVSNDDKMRP